MFSFLVLLAATSIDATTVHLSAEPHPAWIERTASAQLLNFDLIVENPTASPLDVDEIKLSVYDRENKLVLRKLIDGNGTRPSVRTIDLADVAPAGKSMIFNPFDHFERDLDLARLVYDVKLSGKEGSPVYSARLVVEPRPYVTKTSLILPVKGRLLVYDGHDFYAHHRRWDYTIPGLQQLGFKTNFMRYSYDLVLVDESGAMSKGDESDNANWPGFGREVLAAGDGTIAAVVDDQPDDRTFDPSAMNGNTMKIWGNYLVIDHGNGEFSLYGHIKQGSSKVKPGDKVKQGAVIAAIGAAGSSLFPHLHYELQTGVDTSSEGLPSSFRNFERIRGSKRIVEKLGAIESGEFVESR